MSFQYHDSPSATMHEVCHDRSLLMTVLSDYWNDTPANVRQDRFGWRQRLILRDDLNDPCAHCILYCVENIAHKELDHAHPLDVATQGMCLRAIGILQELILGRASSQGSL